MESALYNTQQLKTSILNLYISIINKFLAIIYFIIDFRNKLIKFKLISVYS